MSMNDTLGAALSKILNAEKIGRETCVISPVSTIMKKVFTLMNDAGYIGDYSELEMSSGNQIQINLLGNINKCGVIKPRFPVKVSDYEKYEKRYLLSKDFGFLVVSTPQGVMTHVEAKSKNLGGKLIAYVY